VFKIIILLVEKELKLELRRKAVLSGIGLYLISLIFICYLTFNLKNNSLNLASWAALFWLTVLFSVINSVAKSFVGEKRGLALYYYSVASAEAIIISKIIYNTVFCTLLSLVAYLFFYFFLGSEIGDHLLFFATLLLTSIAFASALTLISSIASKTNNSHVLMAVLSFPMMISILLMAIRATINILDNLDASASYDELTNLIAINSILTALAYILFPYIWRS
jgi:heme exporter protein B